MCGRYTLARFPTAVMRRFGITDSFPGRARYNIAPGQFVPVLLRDEEMPRPAIRSIQWGLVPAWSREPDAAKKIINARAETLAEKPAFKNAVRYRRCLVPADGFYEWAKIGTGRRQPYYFQAAGGEAFCFAGLWEYWENRGTGRTIVSCAIITTVANELVKPIHDRMPVILKEEGCLLWIDGRLQSYADVRQLLVPFPAERMNVRLVGRSVNNPAVDTPECIAGGAGQG